MATSDPKDLATRRQRGKLARWIGYGEEQLATLRPYFEEYVRLHRLMYDTDPEPEDVPITKAEDA